MQIFEVTVVGDVASTAFELEIAGQGFGFAEIGFDVTEGTGTSSSVDLELLLVRQTPRNAYVFPRSALRVLSPRTLHASIDLDDPLPPGIYDLELHQGGDTPVATETFIFEVTRDQPPTDAGVDAGVPDTGDPVDTGVPDVGPPDTGEIPDAGPPDTGGPPDSGLGPFTGMFGYRRLIEFGSAVEGPGGATIVVPVPHATLIAEGKAQADGRDLQVYQGMTPLEFQWSDRFALGTDNLEIIVRLDRLVPAGGSPGDPLALYYGDPNATAAPTDGIFQFVERFANEVAPQQQGNENAWFEAQAWTHCRADRPDEQARDPRHSYCVTDSIDNLARSTLASPRQDGIVLAPGANLTYEMSFWVAGQTPDGNEDATYFAYGGDNVTFQNTFDLNATNSDWQGFAPNGPLTFRDSNNQNRDVIGWRFPANQMQWWQRARVRFLPMINRPSLHFRHVSTDNDTNAGVFILDDWWVRLAIEPAPAITLGPEEPRP